MSNENWVIKSEHMVLVFNDITTHLEDLCHMYVIRLFIICTHYDSFE